MDGRVRERLNPGAWPPIATQREVLACLRAGWLARYREGHGTTAKHDIAESGVLRGMVYMLRTEHAANERRPSNG